MPSCGTVNGVAQPGPDHQPYSLDHGEHGGGDLSKEPMANHTHRLASPERTCCSGDGESSVAPRHPAARELSMQNLHGGPLSQLISSPIQSCTQPR